MEKEKINPEGEAKRAEEARATNIKKTLESKLMQNAVGSNLVKSNPYQYAGELGLQSTESVYEQTMAGKDVKERKDEIYAKKVKEGKEKGVAGEPTYPSNYDISSELIDQVDHATGNARIGELETIAKSIGAKINKEVPEEFKKYSKIELMQKAYDAKENKLDLNKLNEQEKEAFVYCNTLTQIYKRACALNTVKANYFADLNAEIDNIADKYKKEDKSEKK